MKKPIIKIKKRSSKIDYKEIVLQTVFTAAVLSVAVMAPNALKMFASLKNKKPSELRHRLGVKTKSLIKKGYIEETKKGFQLTQKGELELLRYNTHTFNKPSKWDGFWTIISFDFPVTKSKVRDSVRLQLKRIGFIELQKSVWVFPYDCPEIIYLIKTEWGIKDELVYIRAKYISREKKLKEFFDLG